MISIPLPRGNAIGIKVIYSSHCWNERFDPTIHAVLPAPMPMPRVFNAVRLAEGAGIIVPRRAHCSGDRSSDAPADSAIGHHLHQHQYGENKRRPGQRIRPEKAEK